MPMNRRRVDVDELMAPMPIRSVLLGFKVLPDESRPEPTV
jgi:hypothetical protein